MGLVALDKVYMLAVAQVQGVVGRAHWGEAFLLEAVCGVHHGGDQGGGKQVAVGGYALGF